MVAKRGVDVGGDIVSEDQEQDPQHVVFLNSLRFSENTPHPPALDVASNRLFQPLDLYRASPESGDMWCK